MGSNCVVQLMSKLVSCHNVEAQSDVKLKYLAKQNVKIKKVVIPVEPTELVN